MIDLSLALGVLKEGLKLWNTKESNNLMNRVIKLEMDYQHEIAKPIDERSDFKIDNILLELRIISQSFVQYHSKQK